MPSPRSLELVQLCFFTGVGLLALLFAGEPALAAANFAVAGAAWWLGGRGGPDRWLAARVIFGVLAVCFAFWESGILVPALNTARYTTGLYTLDRELFPALAAGDIGWQHPAVTELLQIVYATFYVYPMLLGWSLYRRGMRVELESAATIVVFTYLLSYVGYALVPAVSPYHFVEYGEPLRGLWAFDFLRDTTSFLEPNKLDCFPSGHTLVTAVTGALAYRWLRGPALVFLTALGSAIVVSTIYLRYHYVIDVVAGLALAPACVIVGGWLRRRDAPPPAPAVPAPAAEEAPEPASQAG